MSRVNMKIAEAAEFVGLSDDAVRRAAKSGHLKAALLPGRAGWRFNEKDLRKWAEDGFPGVVVKKEVANED